jgi:hypothetical protein
VSGLYDKVLDLVMGSLANARRNLTKTRGSASDFIRMLNNQKLVELAKRVEKHGAGAIACDSQSTEQVC